MALSSAEQVGPVDKARDQFGWDWARLSFRKYLHKQRRCLLGKHLYKVVWYRDHELWLLFDPVHRAQPADRLVRGLTCNR